MEYTNNPILVAQATEIEKATFYRKTYSHVALGVAAFILIESFFLRSETIVNMMLSLQGY